jgi:hypothetical protein
VSEAKITPSQKEPEAEVAPVAARKDYKLTRDFLDGTVVHRRGEVLSFIPGEQPSSARDLDAEVPVSKEVAKERAIKSRGKVVDSVTAATSAKPD